jgi:hypothetical protein
MTTKTTPAALRLSDGLGAGSETMDSLYGDGSDHPACPNCGYCLKCGDCAVHGCGTGLASCAGCGALDGNQHMPNCPIEAPNAGANRLP